MLTYFACRPGFAPGWANCSRPFRYPAGRETGDTRKQTQSYPHPPSLFTASETAHQGSLREKSVQLSSYSQSGNQAAARQTVQRGRGGWNTELRYKDGFIVVPS
ncbi:unnamed protein product [Protopolystoma xenopodis]|uniref:Uncharacterized protein n=1 Tax=Protopolystoma xenopodis TaxID=117903 RepID=A0A448WDR2_9PLAT|nr:unnamed protein product [Protopolystoma xenopodis]